MVGGLAFWGMLLVSVVLYWTLPRIREVALIVASLAFLCTLDVPAVCALLGWGLAFYWLAPFTRREGWQGKIVFYGLLGGILGFLAWFKYMGPWLADQEEASASLIRLMIQDKPDHSFLVPLGISYFTFKLIHYLIESARGNLTTRSLGTFLLYLVFFPIFPAGPIERFDHFLTNRDAHWSYEGFLIALQRIQLGILKKFFLGDVVLSYLISRPTTGGILHNLAETPVVTVWMHLMYFFLFAYMDFSGYSDIAIGSARLFGIHVMENFNHPLRARNIGEFWKRWHMSLSNWCQAYVYMPTIGLTRNPYLAVIATMSAIALWHAGTWTWLCWGLYHATGIVIFLTWGRMKRRYNWSWVRYEYYPLFSQVVTVLFVIGSFAFMAGYKQGELYPAIRLLVKLVGITLPA